MGNAITQYNYCCANPDTDTVNKFEQSNLSELNKPLHVGVTNTDIDENKTKRAHSAIKIQSHYRGHRARR